MKPLDRVERWLGRYAVPNVTLWIVIGQAALFVLAQSPQGADVVDRLRLVPALVLQGEVWRLLAYPLTPPGTSPLFLILYLMAFYYFGTAVEAIWGTFRYNVYLALGFLLTAAAAFAQPNAVASADYVQTSVFLAYAALFPDARIMLYGVLPVKAAYLAAFTWALYVVWAWEGDLSTKLLILAAVANFFLFFGGYWLDAARHAKRRRDFRRRVEASAPVASRHECRVCGLTSDMAPRTRFRYCSKCAGQCCYCPDHLDSHDHVVA